MEQFDQAYIDGAAALVAASRDHSVSFLQRRLGYSRALALRAALASCNRESGGGRGNALQFWSQEQMTDRMTELPIHTKLFAENSSGGLMLCGINHGWSKEDERQDAAGMDRSDPYKSFFSDKAVNDYPFRNNIVKWFGLWGYPLKRDPSDASQFERAIVQTNWLQSCSNNVNGQTVHRECVKDADSFLRTCEQLQPKLLLLFSKELLWALGSPELRPRVEGVFGRVTGGIEWVETRVPGTKRFKIGRLKFERTTAVSLPHATGARGVRDEFIAAQEAVKNEIAAWWAGHCTKRLAVGHRESSTPVATEQQPWG